MIIYGLLALKRAAFAYLSKAGDIDRMSISRDDSDMQVGHKVVCGSKSWYQLSNSQDDRLNQRVPIYLNEQTKEKHPS